MKVAPDNHRVAVALSGGGRSLANLLAAQRLQTGYEIAAVIASRSDCRGIDIARQHGLPVFVDNFAPTAADETARRLYAWLAPLEIGWIALAGFLKMFPLTPAYAGRIVNIHPALLPRHGGPGMYGDRVHRAVIAAGDLESGATLHFVNERYDEGQIIAQITVPVRPGDDAAKLAARVFRGECRLYPHVLARLVTGALPLAAGTIERLVYAEE